MNVGDWYRLSPKRKWHLVESLIDGDPVTRCGRRLDRRPGDEVSTVVPLTRMIDQPQLCKGGC